jgi:hypothetical protein
MLNYKFGTYYIKIVIWHLIMVVSPVLWEGGAGEGCVTRVRVSWDGGV